MNNMTREQKIFAAQELCRQRGKSPYDWVDAGKGNDEITERWALALIEVEDRLAMDMALATALRCV